MIAYNTGKDKTNGILIFHGEQGLGKTTWISTLIPNRLWSYFKEGMELDMKDKDKVFALISNWIVELGEIDGSMKQEQAKLKAFTTQSNDKLRRPYAKSPDNYPRTTSFFGTVASVMPSVQNIVVSAIDSASVPLVWIKDNVLPPLVTAFQSVWNFGVSAFNNIKTAVMANTGAFSMKSQSSLT